MARLRSGDHWINSRRKSEGAVTPDGTRITRQEAENRGAQEVGFKNAYQYAKGLSGVKRLKEDPAADNGRYFSARTNYRSNLEQARTTARSRGEKFDRAKFDSSVAAMGSEDTTTRHGGLNLFLFLTGRTDRPDAGY